MNEKYFMNAVSATVKDNADFIPPFGKGSMYIRPICFGVSKAIAVQAATEYVFMVFTSPVGPYFKVGAKPLHLYLTDKYHRAAPKGKMRSPWEHKQSTVLKCFVVESAPEYRLVLMHWPKCNLRLS